MLEDDVSGVMVGAATLAGSCWAVSARRSETTWRSRKMSLDGLKITVMTDSPWIEEERSDCTPGTPLIAFSIGCVTSTSTCSAVRPGASVWIPTWGGANSGKTSYLARVSDKAP